MFCVHKKPTVTVETEDRSSVIPVISGGVLASLPGQAQVPSGWRGHVGLFLIVVN